jgi:hypothetical protein
MNIDKLYDYILFMSNKDEKSGDIPPEDFNNILDAVNIELFEQEWNKFLATLRMGGSSVEAMLSNNTPLTLFMVTETELLTSQYIPRYDDFEKLVKVTMVFPEIKDVEEVNEFELSRRRSGGSHKPIELYPVCVVRKEGIYIYPYKQDITGPTAEVVYLRMPYTPYYDYCYKSNDELVYIPPTWSIKSEATGVYDLYDESNALVYPGVTYPNWGGANNDSLSVEIEWTKSAMNMFINRVFEKIGIPLSQADLEQYSQVEQQKSE